MKFADYSTIKSSPRELRLAACALALHPKIKALRVDQKSLAVICVAEEFADGNASAIELAEAYAEAPIDITRPLVCGVDIYWLACSSIAISNNQNWFDSIERWIDRTVECPSELILDCLAGPMRKECRACRGEGKYDADNVATERVSKMTCRVCNGKGEVWKKPPRVCGHTHFCDVPSNTSLYCAKKQDILTWNQGKIQKMAQQIYMDHEWDALPILADALQEAGCTCTAMLEHCQADGGKCPTCEGWSEYTIVKGESCTKCQNCNGSGRIPAYHARGCWVIDSILGKS